MRPLAGNQKGANEIQKGGNREHNVWTWLIQAIFAPGLSRQFLHLRLAAANPGSFCGVLRWWFSFCLVAGTRR